MCLESILCVYLSLCACCFPFHLLFYSTNELKENILVFPSKKRHKQKFKVQIKYFRILIHWPNFIYKLNRKSIVLNHQHTTKEDSFQGKCHYQIQVRRQSNGHFKQTYHQEFKFIMQLKKTSILKGNWKK